MVGCCNGLASTHSSHVVTRLRIDRRLEDSAVGQIGVELAGPLPPELQFYTTFGGAVSATSTSVDAARDLLAFLKNPSAISIIKAQGMEPI
jgi:hypothetical protein